MRRCQYFDFLCLKICHQVSFGELQLTQISLNFKISCSNLKFSGEQNRVWCFSYFNFGRSHDVLKSNSLCIFLNKNINFNYNETESKMENSTHTFRETSFVLKLIYESKIKSETVMSWRSQRKKEGIFCIVYFVWREFF